MQGRSLTYQSIISTTDQADEQPIPLTEITGYAFAASDRVMEVYTRQTPLNRKSDKCVSAGKDSGSVEDPHQGVWQEPEMYGLDKSQRNM